MKHYSRSQKVAKAKLYSRAQLLVAKAKILFPNPVNRQSKTLFSRESLGKAKLYPRAQSIPKMELYSRPQLVAKEKAVFKLKRMVVLSHQFSNLTRILFKKSFTFQSPRMGCLVKLLLKTDSSEKEGIPVFSSTKK